MPKYSGVRKSMELYKRASELMPGGTQLIGRRPSMNASGVTPVYAQSAKGSRFTDVDGNEYIDWMAGFFAIILGYADDVVDNAVKEQIDKGSIYTVSSPLEIELAEELVDTIPSAEMVRYTKGGGEACAMAVRIARGVTGRDKILFCGYHGWHDWYQSANYLVDPQTGTFPFAGIEAIGVPKVLASTAIPFIEDDLEMVENLLKENQGDIAAIIMEPLRSTLSPQGYLQGVKELARAHDVVLIFDEVSCGWRVSVGGAQEYLGVMPDMTVVAKGMSNGYPMGAVVGSREVMEPASRMFISSSYWSDTIGVVAALTTIRELKRRNSTARFQEIGESLMAAVNQTIDSVGISARCIGLPYFPQLAIDLPDESLRPKVNTLFIQEMARRGIFCYTSFRPTLAHTEEDIRLTAEAAAESLEVVKLGLEGNLDDLLISEVKKEPFRRLVC